MLADEDLFGASLATPLSSPTGAGAFPLVGRGVGTDVTEGDGVGTGSQSKLSWNVSAPFGPIFSSQPLASTSAPRLPQRLQRRRVALSRGGDAKKGCRSGEAR